MAADKTALQCIAYGSVQVFLAQGAVSHIEQCAQGRGHVVAVAVLDRLAD